MTISEERMTVEGWTLIRRVNNTLLVMNEQFGAYASGKNDESIASSVLYAFASSVMDGRLATQAQAPEIAEPQPSRTRLPTDSPELGAMMDLMDDAYKTAEPQPSQGEDAPAARGEVVAWRTEAAKWLRRRGDPNTGWANPGYWALDFAAQLEAEQEAAPFGLEAWEADEISNRAALARTPQPEGTR